MDQAICEQRIVGDCHDPSCKNSGFKDKRTAKRSKMSKSCKAPHLETSPAPRPRLGRPLRPNGSWASAAQSRELTRRRERAEESPRPPTHPEAGCERATAKGRLTSEAELLRHGCCSWGKRAPPATGSFKLAFCPPLRASTGTFVARSPSRPWLLRT